MERKHLYTTVLLINNELNGGFIEINIFALKKRAEENILNRDSKKIFFFSRT